MRLLADCPRLLRMMGLAIGLGWFTLALPLQPATAQERLDDPGINDSPPPGSDPGEGDPPGPGQDPDRIPFGGVGWLLVAGAAYGAKKLRDRRAVNNP